MSLLNTFQPLAECARSRSSDVALRSADGHVLSFGDLASQLRAVMAGLVHAGLKPGDRALFALRPSPEAIVLQLAVLRAGGVLAATDFAVGETAFEARLSLLAPRFVLSEPLLLALSRSPLLRGLLRSRGMALPPLAGIREASFVTVGPWVPGGPRSIRFADLCDGPADTPLGDASRHGEDEAFIVFTSGTTEAPKGVVHSQDSLRAILELVRGHLDAREGDVLYARDLHLVVPALLCGASVQLPPHGVFAPASALEILSSARVTHAFGVPHDWQLLVEHCLRTGQRLPRTLRLVMLGAAPVHVPFLERLRTVLSTGTRVLCVYGMTEMGPIASATLEEKLAYAGLGDFVGTLLPGVSARTDPDGELVLRGPNLFQRYLGRPRVAEHATGDLATVTEGKRLALLGRRKDMIIRGHYNIYPELYEPALESIPGVRRCAIVGVYNQALSDEQVVIAVEPEAGLDPIAFEQRFRWEVSKGQHRIDLAAQPDAILVRPLPVSGRSSKVDKRALRAMASRHLRLAS